MNDLQPSATESPAPSDLASRTIRDLVEAYPDTLAALAPLGIDLCCGGGHPLGQALDLHGIDRAAPLAAIARIVARQEAGVVS